MRSADEPASVRTFMGNLTTWPERVAHEILADLAPVAAVDELTIRTLDSSGGFLWRSAVLPRPETLRTPDDALPIEQSRFDAALAQGGVARDTTSDGSALTAVPVVVLGESVGLVEVVWTHPQTGAHADEVLTRLVAAHAMALYCARLNWRLNREIRRSETVSRIGEAALHLDDPDEFLPRVLTELVATITCDAVLLQAVDRRTGAARSWTIASGGATEHHPHDRHGGELQQSLLELATGTVIDRRDGDADDAMVLGVVLGTVAGSTYGFSVHRHDSTAFSPLDRQLVQQVATTLGAALELRQTRLRLEEAAFTDTLTGLANRARLAERAAQVLAHPDGSWRGVAMILLDLDEFKVVNDSLGHTHGDELLRVVGARLSALGRPTDVIARLGGDEFAALVVDADEFSAVKIAERLLAAISEPVWCGGARVVLGASAGVALLEQFDGRPEPVTLSTLLQGADLALYRSKGRGRGRVSVYDVVLRDELRHHLDVREGLREAIGTGALRLVYQPIVHFSTGKIRGVEALVRFDHPVLGPIRPDQFIPIAEQAGLIRDLDTWVLRTAAAQIVEWRRVLPDRPVRMGVNLSAAELRDPGYAEHALATLLAVDATPAMMTVELTESVAADRAVIETLGELQRLGMFAAIDDFGTGYSSLNLLRQLPVRTLKLDRTFIADVATDPTTATIVRTVIELATALGRVSVAEGIETVEQLRTLRALGCMGGQGYLLGRPMDADALEQVLIHGVPAWDHLIGSP